MAVSKKKKKQKNKRTPKTSSRTTVAPHLQEAAESRTAVAATVAWMLSLMATLMAEALGLICRYYTAFVEPVELLTVLSSIMLFVALIAGLVTLCMIPVVFKFSKVRPPGFIVQLAVIAGGLPVIVVVVQYLRGTL